MKAFIRVLVVFISFVLQILSLFVIYLLIENRFPPFRYIYLVFCLYLIFKIIREARSYSFILPWLVIFMIIPIPSSCVYLTIKLNNEISGFYKKINKEEKYSKKYFKQDEKIKKLYEKNSSMRYISDFTNYPITCNNKLDYYSLGEYSFDNILYELKKAEKFIFLEYFIIGRGKMWDSILEILEEKVKNGVEVRLIYDDMGSMKKIPNNYYKILRNKGIKCIPFNRLRLFKGMVLNNRDHRKILVIDGKVAFSGGINLSDEYINIDSKFGIWKDNCIRIKGDAVWNYTVMFLSMWNALNKEDTDYEKYKYTFDNKINNGFVVPYSSNPLDGEAVGEDIYLNMINNSNNYLYIFTPYLIIDSDLKEALILASKRGVDVRIIIPGIPDKKMVYSISESYIQPLLNNGVKVYKYTPGFVHAKVFISDDIRSTVGTLNMDYRSLYLHFECGCYMEKVDIIKDIKKDVEETIKNSHLVTKKERKNNIFKSFIQSILRLFSPLF